MGVMPSLREYVLTLKKYNPNAQDRLLKIYLLKAGWPIAEIERAFAEVNATMQRAPSPAVAAQPVANMSSPHAATKELEIAAVEIAPDHAIPAAYMPAAPRSAPRPSPQPIQTDSPSPLVIDGHIERDVPDASSGGGMDIHGPVVSSAAILSALSDTSASTTQTAGAAMPAASVMPTATTATVAAPSMPADAARPQISHAPLMAPSSVNGTLIQAESSEPHMARASIAPSFDRPTMASAQPFASPGTIVMPGQKTSNPMVQMPSSMQSDLPKPKRKAGKRLMIWIIIIALLGMLGFGYMRFVHGVYLFVNAPIDKNEVLAYLAGSISKVDTAAYSTHVSFEMMPREPGVESFDKLVLALTKNDVAGSGLTVVPAIASSSATSTDMASSSAAQDTPVSGLLSAFSPDSIMDIHIDGLYKKDSSTDSTGKAMRADGSWHVAGTYSGEGLKTDLDMKSVRRDGVTYIRAKAFPEMFFDIKAIRDKWVSISQTDAESVASALPWLASFDSGAPRPANFEKQIARLISIAGEERVLEARGDPQKTIRPGSAWYEPRRVMYSYQMQPNLEHFISFVERSNTILQNEFGTSSILVMTGEMKQSLRSREFERLFKYFAGNGYLKVTVGKSGELVEIASSIKIVSDERQTLLSAEVSLDRINEGVSIESPKSEMTFSDAYVLISGQSKELLQLKRQAKTVDAIRSEIKAYQSGHGGEVPDTLDAAHIGSALPNLVFATSSYAYKKVSKNSYLLSYQIVLPPLPTQFYELPLSLIRFDSSTAASSGSDLGMQYLRFVQGKNTANENTISIEADADKRQDSDRDRITNSLEQYIGTNITKKDSDGDGVDDYEELRQGGNPTGPGSWVGESKK